LIGGDNFNGTAAQLRSFRDNTGATYPLLIRTGDPTGGSWSILYGPWDNYVVIDHQGIVRYHAAVQWPHGNRYHFEEIRGVVDSILAATGVPERPVLPGFILSGRPNPFQDATTLTFVNPLEASARTRITVLDPAGRVVATVYDGLAAPGPHAVRWNGRRDRGGRAASGRYLVRAELQGYVLTRSIAFLR